MEKERPYIILKWAQTSDGFISRNSNDPSRISNSLSQQLVHRWRTEEDAFLVGTQTAAADNPQLNVREWAGRDPVRVVIDRYLRLDISLHLFDGKQPTICYNTKKNEERKNLTYVKIETENFIQGVVDDLYRRNIQSLVVEGGAETIGIVYERRFVGRSQGNKGTSCLWRRCEGTSVECPAVVGNGCRW